MKFKRVLWLFIPTIILITGFAFTRLNLYGTVVADDQPVTGAVVRVQGTAHYVITDEHGAFTLPLPLRFEPLHITASAAGYYVTVGIASPPTPLTLQLETHTVNDNDDYTFISALDDDQSGTCKNCHAQRSSSAASSLPVEEWLADAHSQSAINPRFLSLYNGTDIHGKKGKDTQYRYDAAVGINVPIIGQDAGFKLDYPMAQGSCAACHVPVLALQQPYNADPNTAQGVAAEGITCDFCHKISGVRVNAALPGVLSMDFLRPVPGEQIFLGPFDDTPGDDVYSPLYHQSQFCAACHSGSFWDVMIYNSFGEWLESPYSTGQTCQDCHMPRLGVNTFVDLPTSVTQFVPERDPDTIYSHRMPGASDVELLRNTADLTLETQRDGETLTVQVSVTNSGAGHHIPTDNPLRNIILLVEAVDSSGQSLTLLEGSTIPDSGGVGDPSAGFYAGLPGVLYAKTLADAFTGESPTFAYWRKTRLVSDNRIAALDTDSSTYRFYIPSGAGEITVTTRLLFRRAFIDLMTVKAWDTPDILMETQTVTVK